MQSALSLFPLTKEPPRPIYCLFLTFFLFLLFLFLLSSPSPSPPLPSLPLPSSSYSSPPSFSYLLTGSNNDGDKLLRVLLSLYHPNNVYLLHLDKSAGRSQRERLAREVRAIPVIQSVKNAHVVGEPGFANQRGASALAATLHGAAILLRICAKWDWFVTLDASDYPLVTQDDILHVFSYLPKDLNFVQHTSYIGWKESRRIRPIIVDPGLYLSSRTDVFYATQKRDLPSAYKLFTGSPSVILSRKFIEYTILGTENLPRNLLMYYSNTPSPHLNYFQTLLCNSPDFNSTIINHNLHFTTENSTILDFSNLTQTDAIFASLKGDNNRILGRIDEEILGRERRRIVPGGWCLGASQTGRVDPCSVWGSPDLVRPGPRGGKIAGLIAELLVPEKLYNSQCIWD